MRALLILIAVLIVPAAHAQVATNTRLDAVVSLEQAPDPPLELTVLSQVSFGTVTIPNRLKENTACHYQLSDQSKAEVRESNATQPNPGAVTSGCRFIVAPSSGRVQYKCIADRMVRISTSFTQESFSGLQLTGTWGQTSDTAGGSVQDYVSGMSVPCQVRGSAGKEAVRILHVGGGLTVRQNYSLPTGSSITVGTITVEMVYS